MGISLLWIYITKNYKMKTILAIGPHPDDIELWCFGTLCRYAEEGDTIHFLVLTKWEWGWEHTNREKEAQESSKLLDCTLHIESLKDRYISEWVETIKVIEKYIEILHPDIVFIPSKYDTHQDHRATHLAAIVACRKVNEIYIYQSPSTTVEFKPTLYIDISNFMDTKIQAVRIHTSQSNKIYMADTAIKWLAEYRAFDVLKNGTFFEAFEIYRIIQ